MIISWLATTFQAARVEARRFFTKFICWRPRYLRGCSSSGQDGPTTGSPQGWSSRYMRESQSTRSTLRPKRGAR